MNTGGQLRSSLPDINFWTMSNKAKVSARREVSEIERKIVSCAKRPTTYLSKNSTFATSTWRSVTKRFFERIDELAFGASFVLISDRNPKPLYDQLEIEYRNQLSWDYLEKGPVLWRVEIGRRVKAALRAGASL
jgi:uncharacterized protein (DUF2249 family)